MHTTSRTSSLPRSSRPKLAAQLDPTTWLAHNWDFHKDEQGNMSHYMASDLSTGVVPKRWQCGSCNAPDSVQHSNTRSRCRHALRSLLLYKRRQLGQLQDEVCSCSVRFCLNHIGSGRIAAWHGAKLRHNGKTGCRDATPSLLMREWRHRRNNRVWQSAWVQSWVGKLGII